MTTTPDSSASVDGLCVVTEAQEKREIVLASLPEDIDQIAKMITEIHSALVHAEPSLEEQLRRVIREELQRAS